VPRYRFKKTVVPPYGWKRGECYDGEVEAGKLGMVKLRDVSGEVLADCPLTLLEECEERQPASGE